MSQLSFPLLDAQKKQHGDLILSPANQHIIQYGAAHHYWTFPVACIVGGEKSGKTSLLQHWAGQMGAKNLPNDPLEIETKCSYILDDWNLQADENFTLHSLNRLVELDARLLCTVMASPKHQSYQLPDLASRVDLIHLLDIMAPDDMLMEALVQKYLAQRQLMASVELVQFMAKRLPRDYKALYDAVNMLDQVSLNTKRSLTIPFVKEVLEL